jgi:hypothetical protein
MRSGPMQVWCVSEAVTVLTLTDSATVVRIDNRRRGAALGMRVTPPPADPRAARTASAASDIRVPVRKDPN